MRRRPTLPALPAALLALLTAVLPAAASAQPVPALDTELTARRAEVAALNREVTEITRRMAQNDQQATELARYGTTLATKVDALKKSSRGVVRDAQLKDALRELRRVLATLRNLQNVQRILDTTLRTRQVALARKADGEADRLMARGQTDVRAGRDADAARRFGAALDLLVLGNAARSRGAPPSPQLVPEPDARFRLNGNETPDEMRELGLLLRDGADKLRWNTGVRSAELARLQAERKTVEGLRALASPPSEAAAETLSDLDARITAVSEEIQRLRGKLVGFLSLATRLEQQARVQENALLAEAAGTGEGAP